MPNALLTGVSGLIAHQRMLEVVGHNIANMNTHGFKSSRALFADLLYETIRPASSSNNGTTGGTNPIQVGSGVKVAQVDRSFSQGTLEATGEQFDFAINGEKGFFVVTDGTSDFYTRAGAFSLDEQNVLVTANGLRVTRFSNVGEQVGNLPGFQVPGESQIRIPIGAPVQAIASTEIQVKGNLDANKTPALQEEQRTAPYTVGGVAAVGATLLNNLDNVIVTPFAPGDFISINGFDSQGNTLAVAPLAVSNLTTLQDLVTYIDGALPNATASIANGQIVTLANATGPSFLSVQLNEPIGNIGDMDFLSFGQTVVGKIADTEVEVVTVFDPQGGSHELKLVFEKQTDDVWNMTASIDPSEGSMISAVVANITFGDNGVLQGTSPAVLSMQINGQALPQQLNLDFGGTNVFGRLTHFKQAANLNASSDGAEAGVIVSVRVDKSGLVKGIASNGQVFSVAQIAIASFANPKGLNAIGDLLYQQSLNSGQPEIGLGLTGGRGEVQAGQLEASNVDVAFEFTRLIVAQRGFAANARTITVSDEVLEELTNIIR